MKLWLISQNKNTNWDTYDACVVAAETKAAARMIHPSNSGWNDTYSWASSHKDVAVKLIGEAASGIKSGVVLASFNAG